MQFTFDGYRELLSQLKTFGYAFKDYRTWQDASRCVILRHDIDTSIEQAVRLAELEAENGVKSTYFVLIRTDFYNIASKKNQDLMRRILALGHEVGLHFDEVAYGRELSREEMRQYIQRECDILTTLLDTEVSTVSMHRPSKATLDADLKIPGIINSYGTTFFRDFKYLSDSRRRWREPVLDIIRSGEYDRLHILTHAFWYHQKEESISQSIQDFVNGGNLERYHALQTNISNLSAIMKEEEVR